MGKEGLEKLSDYKYDGHVPPKEEIDVPFNTGITDYLINCFNA